MTATRPPQETPPLPVTGRIVGGHAVVMVGPESLPLRLDLRKHSPTGFSWGFGGSGPAQLALAVLVHFLPDESRALFLYQRFKEQVIQLLPEEAPWRLEAEAVRAWAAAPTEADREHLAQGALLLAQGYRLEIREAQP